MLDKIKPNKNCCDLKHSLKDSCIGKAYNIPISNSDNAGFIKKSIYNTKICDEFYYTLHYWYVSHYA